MTAFNTRHGLSTLVTHLTEMKDPLNAHVTPVYQTTTFHFPDVDTGIAIWRGEQPGHIYTRLGNPNLEQLATKIAALEGLDLLRARPGTDLEEVVAGLAFGSGMAAITAAILARVHSGDTVIAQEALYGATYSFLELLARNYGLNLVFLPDTSPQAWEDAFQRHPGAALAYAETPANPTLALVDLQAAAEIAHRHGAWLMVDNTFATPYCQRPLSLGADIVAHATTKYLAGHGLTIGGVVVSPHIDYIRRDVQSTLVLFGGVASPFDAWLANIGLKTFELRMERHCANAMAVARYLAGHPAVSRVYYPGIESHPGHAVALHQMHSFGGMLSFELKGGFDAGRALMDRVRLATLAVSLGNVDTLISHPASMSASNVSAEVRRKMGIPDGLVRFSVGIENTADILQDLEDALA
jgi:methionine-gamma-lyase